MSTCVHLWTPAYTCVADMWCVWYDKYVLRLLWCSLLLSTYGHTWLHAASGHAWPHAMSAFSCCWPLARRMLLGVVLAHEPLFVCLLWTNKTTELEHLYAGRWRQWQPWFQFHQNQIGFHISVFHPKLFSFKAVHCDWSIDTRSCHFPNYKHVSPIVNSYH